MSVATWVAKTKTLASDRMSVNCGRRQRCRKLFVKPGLLLDRRFAGGYALAFTGSLDHIPELVLDVHIGVPSGLGQRPPPSI